MSRLVKFVLVVFGAVVLLSAVPAIAHVRPAGGLLPDGDERPQIHSAVLLGPKAHNNLLEADLVIDASDNDAIKRFEYRWNSATFGSTHSTSVLDPTVDYSSTRPDTRYGLQIRAIDFHNNASDWFPVWDGITPGVPTIVVAGDSIASGYTKRWFVSGGTCRDDAYSYGSALVKQVNGTLPAQWEAVYVNIAWAGAGVGNMLSGGTDSCGARHSAQVGQIRDLVDSSTWNVVVITAGINSTNWTDVVVGLTRDTAFSFTEAGDRAACDLAVSEKWNIRRKRGAITNSTREITRTLLDTTNARVIWTSYYDITGSQIAPQWTPVGSECSQYMAEALAELHGALQSGLDPRADWVDIDWNVATQTWAGWPHPNAAGQQSIGLIVAAEVTRSR